MSFASAVIGRVLPDGCSPLAGGGGETAPVDESDDAADEGAAAKAGTEEDRWEADDEAAGVDVDGDAFSAGDGAGAMVDAIVDNWEEDQEDGVEARARDVSRQMQRRHDTDLQSRRRR